MASCTTASVSANAASISPLTMWAMARLASIVRLDSATPASPIAVKASIALPTTASDDWPRPSV